MKRKKNRRRKDKERKKTQFLEGVIASNKRRKFGKGTRRKGVEK